MLRLTLIQIFTILIIIQPTTSLCQWSTDPIVNTPICTEINNQREVTICSDEQGGAIMVWRDYRYNSGIFEGDIYAQKINALGDTVWSSNGVIVNNALYGQFRPKIISDGEGGAIIVWAKNSGGFYGYDLVAQRIDKDGNLLWGVNGVAVTSGSATDSFQEIIPDGNGGVIITWHRLPTFPGQTDIYAQKVDANGNIIWTANGVAVCTAVQSQSWPKLISDANGGAIIVWEDGRNGTGTSDIYAQRINENGIAQWSADGIPICAEQSIQTMSAICSDGQGGAFIAWEDYRTGGSTIYGQRINSTGQVQWVTDGKYLSPPSTTCTTPILNFDNSGSAYMVWEIDVQVMETNIGSQKVDLDGNLLWGTSGVDICLAADSQQELYVMNNLAGGIIISWQDQRDGTENVYAQWVNSDGTIKWTADGVAISTAADGQHYPVLTNDGLGGAIIAFEDERNSTDFDVYVQNIDYMGDLGTSNYYYQRNNLNKHIDDGTPTSDTLTVPLLKKNANQTIYDITLRIGSVIHDNVSDLEFTLTHNGITDTLIYRINGNGGVNFTNTFLNDNIGIAFDGAVAPFTGVFIPHNSLANFITTSVSGEWILTITDHKSGDDGILDEWDLIISQSTVVNVDEEGIQTPEKFILSQNYPNPFNPSTVISYQLPVSGEVTLKVYDVLGREVKTLIVEYRNRGCYEVDFNAAGLTSGIYFYQLKAGKFIQTKKMILVK